MIHTTYRLASRQDDQIALSEPGLGRRAVVLNHPNQQSIRIRQTDRAAHPPGNMHRRHPDPEPHPLFGLATGQRVHLVAQCLVSWNS
jgi:hypothetical protein